MITSTQFAQIQDASADLIGKCHLLYFAGRHMPRAAVESHCEDMDGAFRKIASALGYRVTKTEPASLEAAE